MGVCAIAVVAALETSFGGEGVLPEFFYMPQEAKILGVENHPDLAPRLEKMEEDFCAFSRYFLNEAQPGDTLTAISLFRLACEPYHKDPNHYPKMKAGTKETCDKIEEQFF